MILKSETDGHMGPEDLDPRKSTCSLPTDTSQPSEYNGSTCYQPVIWILDGNLPTSHLKMNVCIFFLCRLPLQ